VKLRGVCVCYVIVWLGARFLSGQRRRCKGGGGTDGGGECVMLMGVCNVIVWLDVLRAAWCSLPVRSTTMMQLWRGKGQRR
jgi:hypothetical protein